MPLLGVIEDTLADPETRELVEQVVVLKRSAESTLPAGALTWDEFVGPRRRAGRRLRGAGVQRPRLHPRHLRHDGDAEAGRALPRRLPGLHPRDGEVGLRPATRRRLVVDQRHRLGGRAQLHRLCAAARRLHHAVVRGRDRLPGHRHVLQALRRERRHRRLHVADRRSACFMRSGAEPARKYDLSSVERVFSAGEVLNPAAWEWFQKEAFEDRIPVIDHMWQTETGGPIVGNPYGISHAADQARRRGRAAAGHRGGGDRPGGRRVRAGREGHLRDQAPLPGHDADAVGRAGALRARLLGARARPDAVLQRRRGDDRRGRLRLLQRTRRRDHQDRRRTASARSRSRAPACATPRSPRPA